MIPDPDLVEVDDAAVCRWLSWSFARELDVDTLQVYNSGGATPIFTYLARHKSLSTPLERLKRAITNCSFLINPELELAADFATLFLVSGDAGAPPYASCYTAPGNLFGAPHDRMIKRLETTGLVASILPDEPADHLAIMLEYLAHCFAEHKLTPAAPLPFDEPAEFIRNELITWLPDFQERADRIQVASDMHKALIALTVEVLISLSRQ